MFDKLRRKLRFSIITFIVFSTLVLSISILVYINHMLANDMEIKTSQLSKQYASTISTQMSRIEKAKNLFIAKYNVPEILKSNAYDPYIIGNLSDLKSSNTSIIGSTIVNKNFTYYQDTMLTDKVLSSIFNPNYYEYFENNIKKTAWIFKNMSLGGGGQPYYTGILFNISPIKDGDTTLGYFVISCHIPKIIESFGFKDNEFLKKANLYLYNQYGDTYSLYSYNEDKNIPQKLTAEIPPDSKTIHKHNSLLIYNQIENTEIGLSVYLPFRYIIAENKFTNILIIITTLFIIFLCLMTEKKFTYGIISSLNGLFERMNMYIKSKQETEPEPNIKEKNHVKDTDS